MAERIGEADAFYAALQRGIADPERWLVQRQALAGMLWFKQFYYFDVRNWLAGDPGRTPPPPLRRQGRVAEWTHLNNYVNAQWRVVEPILDDATPVYPYKPETWGPDEAEALIGSDGPWRNPQAELEAAK
jgi:hypothetical protein